MLVFQTLHGTGRVMLCNVVKQQTNIHVHVCFTSVKDVAAAISPFMISSTHPTLDERTMLIGQTRTLGTTFPTLFEQ